jgi:hypothetical protein
MKLTNRYSDYLAVFFEQFKSYLKSWKKIYN